MALRLNSGIRLMDDEETEKKEQLTGRALLEAMMAGGPSGKTSETTVPQPTKEREEPKKEPTGREILEAMMAGGPSQKTNTTTTATETQTPQVSNTYREVDKEKGRIRTRSADLSTPSWQDDPEELAAELNRLGATLEDTGSKLTAMSSQRAMANSAVQNIGNEIKAYETKLGMLADTMANSTDAKERQRAQQESKALDLYYQKAKLAQERYTARANELNSQFDTLAGQYESALQKYQAAEPEYIRRLGLGEAKATRYQQEADKLIRQADTLSRGAATAESNAQTYGVGTESAGKIQNDRDTADRLTAQVRDLLNKADREREYYSTYQYMQYMDQLNQFRQDPEFEAKSQADPALMQLEWSGPYGLKLNPEYKDIDYAIINGSQDAYAASIDPGTFNANDKAYLKNLTAEERAYYNYVYKTQGKAKADEFIKQITPQLTTKQREKDKTWWQDYARNHWGAASAFSVLEKPMAIQTLAMQIADYANDGKIDTNAAYNKFATIPTDIRAVAAEKYDEKGAAVYQQVMSMADNVYNRLVTGGFGMSSEATTGMLKFLKGMTSPTIMLMMGEAAADSIIANKNLGMDDDRALILGIGAGLIEGITENFSMEQLLNPGQLADGFLTTLAKMFAAEASEEGASDLLNWAVGSVYDAISGMDESEYRQHIRQYVQEGMSTEEAARKAMQERYEELALDMLGGGISGGLFGGSNYVFNSAMYNAAMSAAGKSINTGNIQGMIDLGLQSPDGSVAKNTALEIQDRIAKGQRVSNAQVGRLALSVIDETVNANTDADAAEAQPAQASQTAEAQAPAEGAAPKTVLQQMAEKYAAEGKLSGQDARDILKDPEAKQALIDAGLITGREINDSAGRTKVAQAAEQYIRQQAEQQNTPPVPQAEAAETVRATENNAQVGTENAQTEGKTITGAARLNAAMSEETESQQGRNSKTATVVEHLRKNAETLLRGAPVATIDGNEIPKSGRATDRVMAFLSTIGNKVTRDGFGDVLFSRSKVKTAMIGHGASNAKVETIAAVPAVIKNGKLIDHIENYEGRGYDSYIFAAPVTYKGTTTLVGVVVDKDKVTGRYYVHEVVDSNGNIIMESTEPESTVDRSPKRDRPVVNSSSKLNIPQSEQTVNKPRIRTEQAEETLTPAPKPVNLLANSRTEANTNGQQTQTAVGAEPRTSTGEAQDGAALPDRDGGRRDGKHTDRPVGRLARGTKEWRNLPQREKAARRSLHANALGLRDTDGAELGIQNSAGTVKVYPESEWEDDLQNIQKVLTKATGMPVTYVVGPIKVNGMAKGDVRGVFTGNRIIIRIDERTTSAAKIAAHEAFHAFVSQNQAIFKDTMNRMIEKIGYDKTWNLIYKYVEKIYGITDIKNDNTLSIQAKNELVKRAAEDLFANSYAGINSWGINVQQFQQIARSAVRGAETSEATDRRTGPPGRPVLPLPEYMERGDNTAQANEDQRTAAERRQNENPTTDPTDFRKLGFAEAGEDSTAFVRNESEWDAEEQAAAEAMRKLGYEPAFFTGLLMKDGERVDGLIDGNRVLIQSDNRARSIQQIAEKITGKKLNLKSTAAEIYEPAENNNIIAGPKKDMRTRLLDLFHIPKGSRTEYGSIINEYADKAIRNGGLTADEQNEMFDKLYNAGEIIAESNDAFQAARNAVRGMKIYVPESVKHEFGDDWGAFRREAFGQRIYLTDNPADKDVTSSGHWGTLSGTWPGIFAENETSETAMLETILEIAKTAGGETVTPYEWAQREAGMVIPEEEYKNTLRQSMKSALQEFAELTGGQMYSISDSDDASRRTAGTQALDKLGIKLAGSKGRYYLSEQLIARDKAAKSLNRAIKKAERKLKATAAEKEFASGLAAGIYKDVSIPKELDRAKVLELADYYWAEKSMDLNMLQEVRADINAELQTEAEDLLKDVDNFKKLGMLWMNERTPDRIFRAMFGAEKGREIFDWLIRPEQMNEAEKTRWHEAQLDKVRKFEDSKGKTRALTREESELTMLVMEGKAAAAMVADMEANGLDAAAVKNAAENIRNGEDPADAAEEFGLKAKEKDLAKNYAVWMDTQKKLKDADSKIIETAAETYSQIFDEFYDAINDFLVAHGYEPIGYIKGYAPHMQPEETQNLLEKAFDKMGISLGNDKAQGLPASIAGETAYFKPNKRWDPYFLHRTGTLAEYDIEKAYQSYVGYLSDILFHTDDIMRARNFERMIRKTFADENIRDELDWIGEIRNSPTDERLSMLRDAGKVDKTTMLSAAETAEKLNAWEEELFNNIKEDKNYNNLVMWVQNWANILAGKQSMADRGWEYSLGRNSLNFANRLQAAFQRSLVAGSLTSALNQTAQLPMIKAELGDRWYYAALKDILTGQTRGFWKDSDFLTGKHGVDMLTTENWDKFINALYTPSTVVDNIVSTTAVRGAFLKAIHQGQSYSEAMQTADDFGRKVMGSREKGTRPLAYESKGLFSRMIHMFQVEAANSWDHIASDLPYEIKEIARTQGKGKAARTLAALIIKGLLSTFLLNRLTEELYGGTPAPFDVIGLIMNFVASGQGMTTNKYLKTIIDNTLEKIGQDRFFGTENVDAEFDVGKGLEELGYNVMNDVPLLRNLAGVLGWGDQTIPLPGAGGEFADMYNAVKDMVKEGADAQTIENLIRASAKFGAQFVPAGRQAMKTGEGIDAVIRGGSYNKKGNLQYPIDETSDKVKAILFGKNATNAAQEHWASGKSTMSEKQTGMVAKLRGQGMTGTQAQDAAKTVKSFSGDNKWNQTVAYIDRLNITDSLKDEMYFYAGYKESTLKNTPWHSGGSSGKGKTYAKADLSGLRLDPSAGMNEQDRELWDMESHGGNVNLRTRKTIPVTRDNIETVRGWGMDSNVGDYMTVASQTYRDGNRAIVVTPILPNGKLMTQAELDDYMDSLQGSDSYADADNRGIILGVFDEGTWQQNLKESDAFAERIHELHEEREKQRKTPGLKLPNTPKARTTSSLRLNSAPAAKPTTGGLRLK